MQAKTFNDYRDEAERTYKTAEMITMSLPAGEDILIILAALSEIQRNMIAELLKKHRRLTTTCSGVE